MHKDDVSFQCAGYLPDKLLVMQVAKADLFFKCLLKIGITDVIITNSELKAPITDDKSVAFIYIQFGNLIGNNVNLKFQIPKEIKQLLRQLKSNNNCNIYDADKQYLLTNGTNSFYLPKIERDYSNYIIPKFNGQIYQRDIDTAGLIKNQIAKAEFIVFLLQSGNISYIVIPNITVFSFFHAGVADLLKKSPDLKLVVRKFLHVYSDDVSLTIGYYNRNYWLETKVVITDELEIYQYELLEEIA